jgi:transcriptional regulator with XRE-family HTH domain
MNQQVYINIKRIRELKNFTRDFVADELNMSTSGYGKIERGEVDLTLSKLDKIATVLHVDIHFILRFDISKVFHLDE